MSITNMIVRPPKVKEESHLWITITILLLLSAYTLLVQLSEPLNHYFAAYTEFEVVRWLAYVLFFWLLGLLWIGYRKWQDAVNKRRELETVIASISPDALLAVDPDRNIQMCNTSVKKLFYYEPEEVINQKTDLLYNDRRGENNRNEVSQCLQKFGFHVGTASGRRKDGTTFPLELITADLAGQPGAVILARDITERKQTEEALRISHERQQKALEELQQTQEQIVHHERLRVLGQMASYIAHEFNNALTPILGFSEFILSDFDNMKGSDELQKYLTDINTAAKDAASVVSRLREFYKIKGSGRYEDMMDLNKTIEDSISLARPKWKDQAQAGGKDIEFEKSFGEIPLVPGSEEEMHEVLTNLIFNAVDAMPDGGTISISTEKRDNEVVMTITDAGKGMSDEVREQCFEPFFSTNKIDGSGLGLVVVNNVIERHNGRIECYSEENKGTSFVIGLPTSDKTGSEKSPAKAINKSRNLHILVADDEELIRKLVLQFLEIEGHTVKTASNGKEARTIVSQDKFDLLITDWAMPELNGADLVNILRKEKPELPIVMMTGFDSDPHHDVIGTDLNADALLGKPITQDSLKEAINHALEKSAEDSSQNRKVAE